MGLDGTGWDGMGWDGMCEPEPCRRSATPGQGLSHPDKCVYRPSQAAAPFHTSMGWDGMGWDGDLAGWDCQDGMRWDGM